MNKLIYNALKELAESDKEYNKWNDYYIRTCDVPKLDAAIDRRRTALEECDKIIKEIESGVIWFCA